jgi:hypothetical protein
VPPKILRRADAQRPDRRIILVVVVVAAAAAAYGE